MPNWSLELSVAVSEMSTNRHYEHRGVKEMPIANHRSTYNGSPPGRHGPPGSVNLFRCHADAQQINQACQRHVDLKKVQETIYCCGSQNRRRSWLKSADSNNIRQRPISGNKRYAVNANPAPFRGNSQQHLERHFRGGCGNYGFEETTWAHANATDNRWACSDEEYRMTLRLSRHRTLQAIHEWWCRARIRSNAETTWTRNFDDQLGLSPIEAMNRGNSSSLPATEPLLSDKPEHIVKRDRPLEFDPKHQIKMDVPEHLYNLEKSITWVLLVAP